MYLQSDDATLGLVSGLVFAVVAGVMALVVGVALYRPGAHTAMVPLTAMPLTVTTLAPVAAAPTEPSAQAASDAASITVEYGVVKFYFASGNAELAGGARDALVDVVKAAKSGQKVLIAGFHDSKGNALANAGLARRRALAVQEALQAAGVPDSQITLQKPSPMTGAGADAEARRVEISLQ